MLLLWQRSLTVTVVVFFLVLLSGFAWERIAEHRNTVLHPAPGRLVLVANRRLHLLCKGTTTPAIIIEQGAGELSSYWWPLQDEIAKFAQVCTYDRAGFAWSDPLAASKTIADRTQDLHALLTNAGVQAPYIFVAHSYGGLMVREYYRRYPAEVAGLVLIDTPEQSSIFHPDVLRFYGKARRMNQAISMAARFGALRLLRLWVPLDRYGLWLTKPSEYSALCDELASVERMPAAGRVSEKPGSFGALPMIVITHGLPFPGPFAVLETNWTEGQQKLAALSSNHVLIVAHNSNHMIQHDEPALVLEAIRRIHTAVVAGKPLPQA